MKNKITKLQYGGTRSMKQLLTKTLIFCLLTLCILVMTLFAPIVYAEDMTGNEETEALLNSVLSHPDLSNILLFDTFEIFLSYFEPKCSAMTAFLNRDDYVLLAAARYNMLVNAKPNVSDLSFEEYVEFTFLKGVLSYGQTTMARSNAYDCGTVYTCLGTAVEAWTYREELSAALIAYHRETAVDRFKFFGITDWDEAGVEELDAPTNRYNCHSYAWYLQSVNNTYWLPMPAAFLTDGVYEVSNYAVGDKVVFYNSEEGIIHSGIICEINGESLDDVMIISKWGSGGLYKHPFTKNDYYNLAARWEFYTCAHPYSQCEYVWNSTLFHTKTCNLCDKSFTEQHTLNALGICTACGGRGSDITINNHNTEALVR